MRRPSPLPPPADGDRPDADADIEPDVAARVAPPWLTGAPADAAAADARDPAVDDGAASGGVLGPEGGSRIPAVGVPDGDGADGAGADGDGRAARAPGIWQVWGAARARRRALRAEVRRFTVRQRRRRMVLLGSGAALVVLVLGSVAAAYSPLFAVREVQVVGASTLDADAVAASLSDQLGTPLPLVDSSEVRAALIAFPLVESYTLEARPPHALVVRVVERTPVGSVASAAGYTLVDAAGVALSTGAEPEAGYPVIDAAGGAGSSTFRAVGRVMRALPAEIADQVTDVVATTPNDVTLTLGDAGADVVWGNADDSARKALVLQQTMAAFDPAEVSVYDVSSPAAVVVR